MVLVQDSVRPQVVSPKRGRGVNLKAPWAWVAVALLLAAVRLPGFQLWGDVRFTLGVERATARTGWSAAEIWAHRPMLNRQLMAALDHLTVGAFREQQLLLWSAAAAGIVVWALHRSLGPRLGQLESTGLCGGLLLALIWTSSRNLMQPEWFAVLTAVAAVAAAAARPSVSRLREWLVWLAAGLMLAATVLMKWTTVGTAAAGWAVIVALLWRDRRRLVAVTVAAAILTPLLLALQVLVVPHEGLWLREIPHLNPEPGALHWCSLLRAPSQRCGLQDLLANEMVVSPSLLLLPAAVVLLARSGTGLRRIGVVAVPVAGLVATLATVILQAQWFGYHLTAAAMIAGAWTGWALADAIGRNGRPPLALVAPALVAGPVFAVVLSLPESLRTAAPAGSPFSPAYLAFLAAAVISLLALALAILRTSPQTPRLRAAGRLGRMFVVLLSAVTLLVVFVNPVLPDTGFSVDSGAAYKSWVEEQRKAARFTHIADTIHTRIGPDTPVVYLSFGELTYWVDNPTYCRYAAATFVQRSRWVPTRGLRSFSENLRCLSDPRARFVVIETGWLKLPKTDSKLRRTLEQQFDCGSAAFEVSGTMVCPRRTQS